MDPKWGDRIPRGEARKKHGQIRFTYADGKPIRSSGVQALSATTPKPIANEAAPGEDGVAQRYVKPLERNYDAVSQLEAMDEEGLDVAVLFRTFPTTVWQRPTRTISAALGIVGWRIFASPTRSGSGHRH